MSEDEAIDYETLRLRFPWVGLIDEPEMPAASHHRELSARDRLDRRQINFALPTWPPVS